MSVGLEVINEPRQADTLAIPVLGATDVLLQGSVLGGLMDLEAYVREHPYDDEMPYGDVDSRILDVCIDARQTLDGLPPSLQLAHKHAHDAQREDEKGIRTRGLVLNGLVRSFQQALAETQNT